MNRALRKNLFREIRHSFGRFLAIFAIMALGSGFFAGLHVTKDALVEMGNTYLAEQALFDYRLVSTLGLTDADVSALSALPGVRTAVGSITEDVLFDSAGGANQVVRIHSVTNSMNLPVLQAGRMPTAANECLLDARHADQSVLGTTLKISEEYGETQLDTVTVSEFTVVGLIQSPYYLNSQRGTTSLGTGTVDRFIYVLPEAFQQDYFTEIFIILEGTQETKIYSEAYERAAGAMEAPLKSLLTARSDVRYQDIVTDATAEYSDARAEYEAEKAKVLLELQDAYQELKQAEADIVTGQQTLDDSERSLQDARQALDSGKAQWEAGTVQLEEAQAQLELTRLQLEDGWAQYHAGVAAYGEGPMHQTKIQLDQAQAEYDAAAAQLLEQQAVLNQSKAGLLDAEQAVEDGQAAYDDGLKELENARRELNNGWQEYYDGKAEAEQEFADAERDLSDAWEEIQGIKRPTTYVLGRDTNIGYTSFECDTSIMTSIARVFPFLFFLIAALVCITTMTRMVEENRTLIGTLKALGYGKGRHCRRISALFRRRSSYGKRFRLSSGILRIASHYLVYLCCHV